MHIELLMNERQASSNLPSYPTRTRYHNSATNVAISYHIAVEHQEPVFKYARLPCKRPKVHSPIDSLLACLVHDGSSIIVEVEDRALRMQISRRSSEHQAADPYTRLLLHRYLNHHLPQCPKHQPVSFIIFPRSELADVLMIGLDRYHVSATGDCGRISVNHLCSC